MAIPAPASWAAAFSAETAERSRRQDAEPLAQLVRLYLRSKQDATAVRAENAALRAQVDALKGDAAAAASPFSGGSAQSVGRLQTRLLELQDQMTEHYRSQADNAKQRLSLSESNQRLKEEHIALMAQLSREKGAAATLREDVGSLRAQLESREAQLSTAAEELVRVRRLLDSLCREADDLRRENASVALQRERHEEEVALLKAAADVQRVERDRACFATEQAKERIKELSRALQQQQQMVNSTSQMQASSLVVASAGAAAPLPPPQPATEAPSPAAKSGGGGGFLSWVGKKVSAVVEAASSRAGQASTVAGDGVATQHPAAAAPALSSGAPSLYMTSSVAGMMGEYVFAAMPVPAHPLLTIRAHSTEVNAVRLSDGGGRFVATGCSDGNVGLFDTRTGARAALLYTSTEGCAVLSVDMSGSIVVGGCSDRAIRVWDATTQRVVRSLTGHSGKVQALVLVPPAPGSGGGGAFSRGLLLSGSADRTVKVWDLRDGRPVRTLDTRSIVNGLALSGDGALLAVANQDAGVRLFDMRSTARVAESAPGTHTAAVTGVCFSRSDGGAKLLSMSRDNSLRVLDGRTLDALGAFLPPSALLDDGSASVTALLGRLRQQQQGHGSTEDSVSDLAASPAGAAAAADAQVAASSAVASLSAVPSSPHLGPLAASAGSGGAGNLMSGSGSLSGGIAGLVMRAPGFRVPVNWSRPAFSPNGHYAVAGGDCGTVFSWSTDSGNLDSEISGGSEGGGVGRRSSRARSGSGASAAAGGFSDPAALGPHEGCPIFAMDYSGSLMATGDEVGRVVIWADGPA